MEQTVIVPVPQIRKDIIEAAPQIKDVIMKVVLSERIGEQIVDVTVRDECNN